jgi:2-polyprenyl-6-methoxyphenol hydroxylase-like FAD-dependent oxidoreductase
MKRVLIAGAGIGGCAAAISFAQHGWKVTVVEKLKTIFTEGAGICLYSNALKTLDQLDVLDQVLKTGASMKGTTVFLDSDSKEIGIVNYKTVDTKYPAYTGINRQLFLEILFNKAVDLNVDFKFDTSIISCSQTDNLVTVVCDTTTLVDYDLFIVANGTNSNIRKSLWPDSDSTYSGFGLWHSMHNMHPSVTEKVTVVMPDKRFGIIPMSDTQMYIWGSVAEPNKRWIDRIDQPAIMAKEFASLTGYLKDVIDELDKNSYVHYTSVDEVTINDAWHKGRVVLLGDAAHASLPFMAQGGAMALQDALVLGNLCSNTEDIESALVEYKARRKPVVDTVQQMCRNIGKTYSQSTVNLEKAQEGLDKFYSNTDFFN